MGIKLLTQTVCEHCGRQEVREQKRRECVTLPIGWMQLSLVIGDDDEMSEKLICPDCVGGLSIHGVKLSEGLPTKG